LNKGKHKKWEKSLFKNGIKGLGFKSTIVISLQGHAEAFPEGGRLKCVRPLEESALKRSFDPYRGGGGEEASTSTSTGSRPGSSLEKKDPKK